MSFVSSIVRNLCFDMTSRVASSIRSCLSALVVVVGVLLLLLLLLLDCSSFACCCCCCFCFASSRSLIFLLAKSKACFHCLSKSFSSIGGTQSSKFRF